MVKCVNCGEKFIGKEETNYSCPNCGTEQEYECPDCNNRVHKIKSNLCKKCGWFTCPACNCCHCNSKQMGWNGSKIYYAIDKKDETIAHIGIKYKGQHKSYIRLHNDDKEGDLSQREIIELIIQLARKQKLPPLIIRLCPRLIADSNIFDFNSRTINNTMRNINLEEKNLSTTHYKELIAEIKQQLIKYKDDEFENFGTKKLINDLPTSRRKELDKDRSVTRIQLETTICQGLIKKVKQGGIGSESLYESSDESVCQYWVVNNGIAQCQCPKDNFVKWKLVNGKYLPISEVK